VENSVLVPDNIADMHGMEASRSIFLNVLDIIQVPRPKVWLRRHEIFSGKGSESYKKLLILS
jgi:hypothetical protein